MSIQAKYKIQSRGWFGGGWLFSKIQSVSGGNVSHHFSFKTPRSFWFFNSSFFSLYPAVDSNKNDSCAPGHIVTCCSGSWWWKRRVGWLMMPTRFRCLIFQSCVVCACTPIKREWLEILLLFGLVWSLCLKYDGGKGEGKLYGWEHDWDGSLCQLNF